MHGKGEFKGHATACGILGRGRHIHAATRQGVEHIAPHAQVVFVVVCAALGVDERIGHARPLRIVASRFQVARKSRRACLAAFRLPHSTAETHGIGSHHAAVVALVGERYAASGVLPFVELERAEIDPRAAAHLLIDGERGAAAFVINGVVRVGHGVWPRGVTHIHGVASGLGNVGRPYGGGEPHLAVNGLCIAVSALAERVHAVHEQTVLRRKAERVGRGGPCGFVLHGFGVCALPLRIVVVHYRLVGLPVAFTWTRHHCPGVFEHGEQEGIDERLREDVLRGTEQMGALPLPRAGLVVTAVAGPDEQVTAFKSARHLVGQRGVLHPRLSRVVNLSPKACLVLPRLPQNVRHEVLNELPLAVGHGQPVGIVGSGESPLQFGIDATNALRCEGL